MSLPRRLFACAALLLGASSASCGSERRALHPTEPDTLVGQEGARGSRLENPAAPPPAADPSWAEYTASPRPAAVDPAGFAGCARSEQGLVQVAGAVAGRAAEGLEPFDGSELDARLRAAGSPHVWPHTWLLVASGLSHEAIEARFEAWLAELKPAADRRCGTAWLRRERGQDVAAAVVVDALGDLSPMPARARLGQWLRLEARLDVDSAPRARVLVCGEHGPPRLIPSSLGGPRLRSVFNLDQPGLWRVQVMTETATGPRPALEAWVFVDTEPELDAGSAPAPGEAPGIPLAADADAAAGRQVLLAMLNTARHTEQLLPLHGQARLDELAQAHAEAMRQSGRTAHDVGDGSPTERFRRSGLWASRIGENVAFARTLAAAHRALWNSPSHRGNLLDAGFDAVGLGIAVAAPPSDVARASASPEVGVWVSELFVDHGDSGLPITR